MWSTTSYLKEPPPAGFMMDLSLDGACKSVWLGLASSNLSTSRGTGGSALACNHSVLRRPYSLEATAAFATAITAMVLFTIFGNILVIIAVLTSRSLRGPQNLFLVSLAAADILVATLIIPFSLANELMGYWYFHSAWCEIYLALDVFFCTSSIVHLCAISLDRYLSVSRAIKYNAQRTPGRIKAAILVVWLISAVISFPPLLSMNKRQESQQGPQCQLNNERWYILYSTVGSFFAPCLIMILVYVRIYQIAKQHTRCPPGEPRKDGVTHALEVKPEAQQNGSRNAGGLDIGLQRPPDLAVAALANAAQAEQPANSRGKRPLPSPTPTPSPVTPSPIIGPKPSPSTAATTVRLPEDIFRRQERKGNMRRSADNSNRDSSSSGSDVERGTIGPRGDGSSSLAGSPGGGLLTPGSARRCRDTVATSGGTVLAEREARLGSTPNTARRKALVNREKRLTFVLAVVIGVFVVCWFPFFFSYSLQAICPESCSLPQPLFKFFFWIGYCNSSLNPLIYTIFNKDFRKAFKKILYRSRKDTLF